MKELLEIQGKLKVLKSNTKSGIQFKYRTCEDILQEVKPLCIGLGVLLTVTDEVILIGERYYIKATASVSKDDKTISASGMAREPEKLMSMSYPQITGSCSSYARKTALGGLFAIDNNEDPDSGKPESETLITDAQIKILNGYAKDYQGKDEKKHSFIVDTIADTTLSMIDAQKVIDRIKGSKA